MPYLIVFVPEMATWSGETWGGRCDADRTKGIFLSIEGTSSGGREVGVFTVVSVELRRGPTRTDKGYEFL